jgi:hypothetical protein
MTDMTSGPASGAGVAGLLAAILVVGSGLYEDGAYERCMKANGWRPG